MNKLNLFAPAYYWPYCALAARYKEDSGDGDFCFDDFIDDLVPKWIPGSKITKFFDKKKLDFTYSIEHDGKLLLCFLGTEGKATEAGWRSDFSPGIETEAFLRLGGHVDFIRAGELSAKYFALLADRYRDNIYMVGHSRGGPRCMAAARYFYRKLGIIPARIIPYCSPPVFTHSAADEYDKCGLGAVTIRPTMSNDPVDFLGLPFLKHVGMELKLPKIKTKAIKQRGLIGRLVYGHAYSSVFECMIKYCENNGMKKEAQWLLDTEWVSKV